MALRVRTWFCDVCEGWHKWAGLSCLLLAVFTISLVAFDVAADVPKEVAAVPHDHSTLSVASERADELINAPPQEVWVGSVFSGQRRASNVPDQTKTNQTMFYGLKRLGYGGSSAPKAALLTTANHGKVDQDFARKFTKIVRVPRRGKYRTVCVRLCDGHYFPISERTSFKALKQDEARCLARCNVPARLYVAPSEKDPQSAATQLISLSGEPYSELKTAYLYRSKYVADCSCMAPPGSTKAKKRHVGYAQKKHDIFTQRLIALEKVGVLRWQSVFRSTSAGLPFEALKGAKIKKNSTIHRWAQQRPGPRHQPR